MFSERVSIHLTGRPSLRDAQREQDLLAVDLQLGAEAAADVGRDHAHAVLGHAELEGEEQAQEVRDLRRASRASARRAR